jgi:nucleotide-binding universal stress UspA family protein
MSEPQLSEDDVTGLDHPAPIVVSYAANPEGRAALKAALAEAGRRGAELIVVHTSADTEIAELRAELDRAGVSYQLKGGAELEDPAEELISVAEQNAAEFIIIGLRRRSPVGKLLLGSNAQRVLLDASCPVLAVKADLG